MAGGGIVLHPLFNGTYRLTSYFDHTDPDYTHDNDVTIYTGESVASCSPYCYHGHNGIDWGMPTGTDVLATAAGVVEIARYRGDDGYGCRIQLDHGNSYKTIYAHMDVNFRPELGHRFSAKLGHSKK
jgi:murein DD-endopeptidase MepM/ murein hydrolase activator NlpD